MTKNEPHKSICFDFEKDEQKQNFFDKAKKSDIIYNHDSVFLHKILSVKNPLLDNILRQNKSQVINKSNSIKNKKNNNNKKTNLLNLDFDTIKPIKGKHFSNLIVETSLSPQNLSGINLFSSPKIVVNKNKNLGNNNNSKEKEGLSLNTTFFNGDNKKYSKIKHKFKKDRKKEKGKYIINSESSLIPETGFTSLYTKKNLRKPVVIKFINGISSISNYNKINNTTNNTIDVNNKISLKSLNNVKKINFSMSHEKEREKDKPKIEKLKLKPEERIKSYNHHKKTQTSELYRRYEDLERKSIEISKRKMKKNSSSKLPINNFKKEINLLNLKKSLDNIIKSKSKKKERKCKKRLVNKKLKNFHIIKKIEDKPNLFRNNKTEDEKNDFCIMKNNTPKFNYWQEQRSIYYNNNTTGNDKIIDNNKSNTLEKNHNNINHKTIPSSKSQKILKEEDIIEVPKNYYVKKKIININLIGENRHENIYNINLNSIELYNNFNKSISYNNSLKSLNDRNSFIKNRYSKKSNSGNKTPHVTKTFIEDYKTGEKSDSNSKLSYSQSQSILSYASLENKIKVNKKNHSTNKRIPYSKTNLLMKEEEEIINREIKNNLQILNAIETLDKFIKAKNKNILYEAFKILIDFIHVKTINYNTLQTNVSLNSGMKYVKKIISLGKGFSKEKVLKSNGNFSKEKIIRKKHFEVEKQKFILQKRKELGFFERYENCKDFIDNFRIALIKYLFKDRLKK